MNYLEEFNGAPCKIFVCRCSECKATKNRRANRRSKIKIKRMLNKKRRKVVNTGVTFYWA